MADCYREEYRMIKIEQKQVANKKYFYLFHENSEGNMGNNYMDKNLMVYY